jgi:hypothetical protein
MGSAWSWAPTLLIWPSKNFLEVLDQLGSYQYVRDRVHDAWLPNSARQQLRRIIKKVQCRYIKAANTDGRMSIHKRIKTRLTLAS